MQGWKLIPHKDNFLTHHPDENVRQGERRPTVGTIPHSYCLNVKDARRRVSRVVGEPADKQRGMKGK